LFPFAGESGAIEIHRILGKVMGKVRANQWTADEASRDFAIKVRLAAGVSPMLSCG